MLSENVLSRGGYMLYMLPLQLWKWRQIQCMWEGTLRLWYISMSYMHKFLLLFPENWMGFFNMWMSAKNSKEVTCSPLSCIKRERKKKEFQRWIQSCIWVGGYGYKDCSGGLLVGMPLWSRFTAYVASCCRDTKNKCVGKWAE